MKENPRRWMIWLLCLSLGSVTGCGADPAPPQPGADTLYLPWETKAELDTVAPDTVAPDTAAPDTAAPDTAAPDTAAPDTATQDVLANDTAKADVVVQDVAKDTQVTDVGAQDVVLDTTKADTTKLDTVKADTTQADTAKPDTVKPDTTQADTGPVDAGPPPAKMPPLVALGAGMPSMWNLSPASDAHAAKLAKQALSGLGFPQGSAQGPRAEDRVFVGRYYIAWLDQTGFVGKMNGLWRLNGQSGDKLDIVLRDGGRALNLLIVGEWGKGQFAPGYAGGEHIEFPSKAVEANDKPSCVNSDWCNQYAHDEAASITDSDIPWWSSCNAGQVGWGKQFAPIEAQVIPGGVRLLWEAPLVKEADGDGAWDGDACHAHWLFPDGKRRPVYLQVGYELFNDKTHLDRLVRFRNPAGNPAFTGPMSAIGGFVFTRWPNPHPLKRYNDFIRPKGGSLKDGKHGLTLKADVWNDHQVKPASGDEVWGWVKKPIGLSAYPKELAGRTLQLSHIGPSDNDDTGLCLCSVHGAVEMGGGLLHGGISLPIAGGASTIMAKRRLDMPGPVLTEQTFVYQAETDLNHGVGKKESGGWAANTAEHAQGHMLYGPYATNWIGQQGTAVFQLMVDNNSADDLEVVVLDVFDATTGKILASRSVKRKEFAKPFSYQGFALPFQLGGVIGHKMEVRVFWKDVSYVKVDYVSVTLSGGP